MKNPHRNCLWFLCLVVSSMATVAGITPTNLLCESKPSPVGLTESSPRLSWQLAATEPGERGQFQTAYQIQVASSMELLAANQGDLWDSGQVAGNQTAQIAYAGTALVLDQVCYWHVRAWDRSGQPSPWSSPASWSMGLLLTNRQVTVAKITWIAQGTFANNSVLALAGAVSNEVYGVDFGGSGSQTTANGYTFADYSASGNVAIAGSGFGLYGGYLTGGATTGDAALNSLLTHGLYGGTANAGTLKNLTVGQTYRALALLADTRGAAAGGTTFTINDGLADSPTQAYAFANGASAVGGYLLGTFTATATTQAFTIKNLSANANSQYNLILLEKGSGNIVPPFTNVVQSQWTGQWIGRDDAPSVVSAAPTSKTYLAATHLRKDFSLSELPARAVLYVTSLGLVEPHLNGAKVGNDYFVPGWTDYTKRVYYRAYEVTPLLHTGSNTLGAILGDGWFRGNVSILGQNYYGTKTRLCAELHMSYAGGTNQIIASDRTWTAGFGPIQQSDIQAGEQYDARLEVPGWDLPGFTNAWSLVATGAELAPVISAAPAEPVQANGQFVPVAITQPQAGLYVVDFGQNFAGWARVVVSNQPAGSTLVMRFGEWLKPDGTVFRDNLRSAAATDTYVCKGGAVEIWEPHFTYHGFQYLEVTGLAQAPTTNTFTGIVVHSSLPPAGTFQCSSDLINRTYSNMLWTVRANAFDIPTDCPQRDERMGWCDGTEVMRSGMFMAQGESFYGKWYQDMVDGKLDATTYPQMAPTPHKNFGFASGWSDCGVLVPYWVYQTYGDTRLASRFYSDMASHLQHYAATAVNYIGQSGSYGDWLAVDNSTPGNLVSTAFYARCASEMAEMAQMLGKTSDAAMYQQLFTNICAAFQASFVSSDGTVGSGSQSGYVLALYFNLLTPAQRPLAAAKLAAAVNAQNGHLSTGMVTTYMLMPTLESIGRSDLAYQMLAKTDYPSWGYMLGLGATTMWEHWGSVNADRTVNTSDSMNSLNHANLGTCAEWFYRGILGIDLLQPGFQKILINPQIGGGLTSAQGSYNSVRGPINSSWQFTNQWLSLNVTVPANTTAEIHVATTNAAAIIESGVAATNSPGVIYVGISNGAAIFTVGSGSYAFSSPFVAPVPPPGVMITVTNQTGSGSGTYFPPWTVVTNGSLIAGQSPIVATGNFSEEAPGRNVNWLTAGGSLGITLITVGTTSTTSTNYVTGGNGTGPDGSAAGSALVYALAGSTNGYDLTNITVYGGWADNGRDQQAYSVYYSTVMAPGDFIFLTAVNDNPPIANNLQSATRVTLASSSGVLATNVARVKFDFTSPASENGYCGYGAITLFGNASVAQPMPAFLNAKFSQPNNFIMNVGNLVAGRSNVIQSTTNLGLGVWITETGFMATQPAVFFTNSASDTGEKFYRVVGF